MPEKVGIKKYTDFQAKDNEFTNPSSLTCVESLNRGVSQQRSSPYLKNNNNNDVSPATAGSSYYTKTISSALYYIVYRWIVLMVSKLCNERLECVALS